MHRVQTLMRLTAPSTIARTRCRFGIHRRLDTLWAWLIRFPNTGALPQTSHILAMIGLPQITRKAQILIVQRFLCNRRAFRKAETRVISFTYLNPVELTPLLKGCNFEPLFLHRSQREVSEMDGVSGVLLKEQKCRRP